MKRKDKATNSGNPFEEYSLEGLKQLVYSARIQRAMMIASYRYLGYRKRVEMEKHEHME